MNGDDLEHAGRKRLAELNEAMKDADPSDALRQISDFNARAGSAYLAGGPGPTLGVRDTSDTERSEPTNPPDTPK